MDEFSHRRRVIFPRGLTAAALVFLVLAGCEQLGLGKKKEDPLVPPPPQRKPVPDAEIQSAKRAGPTVKLDGSAQTEASPSLPNAPTIGAGQAVDGPPTRDKSWTPAGSSSSSPDGDGDAETAAEAEESETEGDSTGRAQAEGSAKRDEVVQVGGLRTEDAVHPDALENPGADVISPIELEGSGSHFKKGQVAALVNGSPIFVEDVLRALPKEAQDALEQNEKAVTAGKAPAEMVRKYRQ
ncbi:MAG: hypothetical protein ACM3U2_05040, partial [Deltaproteobacteria bacterium]